jgi:hypothetical protein
MADCYKRLKDMMNRDHVMNAQKWQPHKVEMMRKVQANFIAKYPAGQVTVDELQWRSTPGGQVMQLWEQQNGQDLEDLLRLFCQVFQGPGAWTWSGGNVTPEPEKILDGDADAKLGQCEALANAFRLLATCGERATCGEDLGLELSEAEVERPEQYSGENREGFIADHPIDGILNLQPNVYMPCEGLPGPRSPLAPLYRWANHKVVKYRSKWYDPSYAKIWNQIEDMAQYHVRTKDAVADRCICEEATSNGKSSWLIAFTYEVSLRLGPGRRANLYMGLYDDEAEANAALKAVNADLRKGQCTIL